ncbi:MAG TPA: hypothetical protein VNQ32_13770 [Steroidobacteraceae bacterium]|nr:hypothetical protein [Steroidobacteraceae bacterium]
MNSIIKGSRLVTAVLCAVAIAGCDSIRDVRSEPSTAAPGATGVLEGTVIGLSPQREVVVHAGFTNVGNIALSKAVFGALGFGDHLIDVTFAYPTVPVGTPYNLTIEKQPFGKICSIENPSGAVGSGAPKPVITCVEDASPAGGRYTIGGTVAPEIADLPGFTVTLNAPRDYGVESIVLDGATSFQFENTGYNPPLSSVASIAAVQAFQWTLTATYQEGGRTYQCRVVTSQTNNTPSNSGTSSANSPTTAPVTRHVRDCAFPIEANVKYSAPPGGADQPMGAGGVTLALRRTGNAVPPESAQPVTITNFTPGSDRVTLWTLPSYIGAAYDLVVTDHPEGQTCIVRVLSETAAGGVVNAAASLGSVIWLSDPVAPAHFTPSDANIANGVSIRCRNNPAPANQLSGVFANYNINIATTEPFERIRDRQFMTFFDDGTFLFATHGNSVARVGLEHGFYNYDPVAQTLDFNVFLDASTEAGTYQAVGTTVFVGQPASLSNTLGYGTIPAMSPARRNHLAASAPNGGVARATNVTVNSGSPASISMTFSGVPVNGNGVAPAGAGTLSQTLTFTEPTQIAGQMTGAWVSPDHRRLWVFNYNNTSGLHAGVNGPINFQDACYVFDDPQATTSFYTRRGGSTGCMTLNGGGLFVPAGSGSYFEYYEGGFATMDCVPSKGTGLFTAHPGSCGSGALTDSPVGFLGRFPGAQGAFDERPPSPNTYTVIPGTPEVLSVQRTLNGEPLGSPVEFTRAQVKLD